MLPKPACFTDLHRKVSMIDAATFDMLIQVGQSLGWAKELPFGGIQVSMGVGRTGQANWLCSSSLPATSSSSHL